MDVLSDATLRGDAGCLLVGGGHALLAEPHDGLLEVAVALGERLLAVHHAGAGLVADLLDLLGRDAAGGRGGLGSLLLLGLLLGSLGGGGGGLRDFAGGGRSSRRVRGGGSEDAKEKQSAFVAIGLRRKKRVILQPRARSS